MVGMKYLRSVRGLRRYRKHGVFLCLGDLYVELSGDGEEEERGRRRG
jgi:hypothetical protein